MEFGDRLKQLRLENNLTQRDLGKILNLSDRVIGYYESNERFPKDPNTLKKLAEYFHVTTDYLLGITNARNPYIDKSAKAEIEEEDPLANYEIAAHKEGDEDFTLEQKRAIANLIEETLKKMNKDK